MRRYEVFNAVLAIYDKNKTWTYEEEKGLEKNFIAELEKKGYKHCLEATYRTGGDNDYIVIDHKRKEFCYWENGFTPFSGEPETFPNNHNLKYWAEHRE